MVEPRHSSASASADHTQVVRKERVIWIYWAALLLASWGAALLLHELAAASGPGRPGSLVRSPSLWIVLALPIATAWGAFRLGSRRAMSGGPSRSTGGEGPNVGQNELLATISREIRTPLVGLEGLGELLARGTLGSPDREIAQAVRRSSESLLETLQAILDANELESKTWRATEVDFDLQLLLEDSLEQVGAEASAGAIQLGYLLAPDVPILLRGDALRLQRSLVAVLRALLRRPLPALCIQVECSADTASSATLWLRIGDVARQAEALASAAHESSAQHDGLALWVARQVVERLGGSLRLDLGAGTLSGAELTWPLRLGSSQTHLDRFDLAGRRALVASDTSLTRLQLERQLQSWNAQLASVSDWTGLVAALRSARATEEDVHLVIVEATLPGLVGVAPLQALAHDVELGAPRVILVASPHTLERWVQRAHCPECAWLPLPIRREKLRQALSHVFATASHRAVPMPGETVGSLSAVGPTRRLRRGKILLVDDNGVNRRVAHLMLTKAGYEVGEARDGEEGCEQALAGDYDLILMDVQMPRCNGYEAARAIRAAEQGSRRTPILAMTARAMDGDVQECLDAGMDGYVSKPVRGPALLAAVESWVAASGEPQHSAAQPSPEEAEELPALAPAALAELRAYSGDGDESIVLELATLYLQGATVHIASLRDSLAARDCQRFERAAHTLKGSSGTLGARQLEARCRELEDHARNGRLPESTATIEELSEMLKLVRERLEREFEITLPRDVVLPNA